MDVNPFSQMSQCSIIPGITLATQAQHRWLSAILLMLLITSSRDGPRRLQDERFADVDAAYMERRRGQEELVAHQLVGYLIE